MRVSLGVLADGVFAPTWCPVWMRCNAPTGEGVVRAQFRGELIPFHRMDGVLQTPGFSGPDMTGSCLWIRVFHP